MVSTQALKRVVSSVKAMESRESGRLQINGEPAPKAKLLDKPSHWVNGNEQLEYVIFCCEFLHLLEAVDEFSVFDQVPPGFDQHLLREYIADFFGIFSPLQCLTHSPTDLLEAVIDFMHCLPEGSFLGRATSVLLVQNLLVDSFNSGWVRAINFFSKLDKWRS